jgi:hypothetical protein
MRDISYDIVYARRRDMKFVLIGLAFLGLAVVVGGIHRSRQGR